MYQEKKLAVLIDSDNVSAKHAQFILQEAEKYGTPTFKRVYGDWEQGGNGWSDPAINYSIMPVHQCVYVTEKNATDFSMIIDAMDILYTGDVDGFVLVTSDSDFTRLAIRLREAGKMVIGIGEPKTPRAFTSSCHHFCYITQTSVPESVLDEAEVRKAVIDFMQEHEGERITFIKINDMLTLKFGKINFSELGFKRFSSFIDSFKELRRSNTFVTLKKKKAEPPAPVISAGEATEEQIVEAMKQFFEENIPQSDNMMKIESYLTTKFGKLDFSRFGSKRFAKFIDKRPEFNRNGTDITIAEVKPAPEAEQLTAETFAAEAEDYARSNSPKGGNVGQLNNYLIGKFGKDYIHKMGFADFKTALSGVDTVVVDSNIIYLKADEPVLTHEEITTEKATEAVQAYAEKNAPVGGNIGQLNNELMARFGKNYCADLGFADYRSMLAAMSGVYVKKNRIYPAIVEDTAEAADSAEEQTVSQPVETEEVVEVVVEAAPEKPDLNTIRREVLNFVATAENGAGVSALGRSLGEKYGKGFIKELGYTSVKKLATDINGIIFKNNKLFIDEAFAQQTEQIEQFVIEFANSDGKRTIRSLGIELKKNFDGFDFKNYGFARFTDFINAIEGVTADRYYVNPEKSEE